jgi:hypothetical protein
MLINKLISPITSLFNSKLKQNFKDAVNSSDIKLSQEEIDFINSINEMDNPIIMIASLKEF